MDKLKMQSKNIIDENIEYIAERFPNVVTEVEDDAGGIEKKINFELLKQELSGDIVEGDKERYSLTWPGKKQAMLVSNTPIKKTLRPCKNDSTEFNRTHNLYIEGNNVDVLKLLRETYLGQVSMIYIDPPYNTGDDRIYKDDFSISADEYCAISNQVDEDGNKMVQNLETNGKFHSDWLSSMYPCLKLARDLLAEDGFIVISIDDGELFNLKKICDEIYGEGNFVNNISIKMSELSGVKMKFVKKYAKLKESALIYAKDVNKLNINIEKKEKSDDELKKYLKYYSHIITNPEENCSNWNIVSIKDYLPNYNELSQEELNKWKIENGKNLVYRTNSKTIDKYLETHPNTENIERLINADGKEIIKWENKEMLFLSNYTEEISGDIWMDISTINLNKEAESVIFDDGQKPLNLIKKFILNVPSKDCLVLDFFSGSATTAHAIMQLNAEDGGHRRFIMVQIPEVPKTIGAINFLDSINKPHYITEIGKERIRRAGNRIKKENPSVAASLDTGFRVLKLDSSNMKDVYYNPSKYTPDLFSSLEDNIMEDRTNEDLLFQVMLDLGIMLDSKIEEKTISDKKIFIVTDEDKTLICCFDKDVTDDVVTEIAKSKPDYAVFRDSSMSSDSVAINFEQIFKTYSPSTTRKVL